MTVDVRTSTKILWFLPTHGDGRYLGTSVGGREVDFKYLRQVAQAADQLGYYGVLIPTGRSCEDSWIVASSVASHTERLRYLVAVRPGLQSPSVAARMTATLDRLTEGRVLVNVVTGGDPVENRGDGIFLDSTDFIPIRNNVIANNIGNGIAFGTRSDCAGAGNTFKGNSIGAQGGLGILLEAFGSRGVNDPLDVDGSGCDSYGNHGQNYPVIDLVTYRPDKTLLDFTLPSEASKTYDIEVFSNAVADTTNSGRGETSRATTTVMTDAAGSVSVTNFVVSNTAPDALNISMLATEQSQGDTSEFSYAYITPASFAPLAGFSAFAITAGGNQSQTITFTNILGQALSFPMPSILPAGNFTVTANTCGLSVAFPGTCQITVQYARAMAGLDSAVLEVTLPLGSNPPAVGASTKFQFPLSGTATAAAPAITVTGTTTFPATSLNAQSAIQTITITNTGGVNLSISAIATLTWSAKPLSRANSRTCSRDNSGRMAETKPRCMASACGST